MRTLICTILIVLIGCSSPSLDKLKVGMSYDEVTNVMGNPEIIRRGWTTTQEYTYTTQDSGVELSSSLNVGGQLVEIAWIYANNKVDTSVYLEKRDSLFSTKETRHSTTTRYLINGTFEIHKLDYLNHNPGEWVKLYENGDGTYSPVGTLPGTVSGTIQIKTIDAVQKGKDYVVSIPRSIKLKPKRVVQLIESKLTLTFDSASGRLKTWGYQPISVTRM